MFDSQIFRSTEYIEHFSIEDREDILVLDIRYSADSPLKASFLELFPNVTHIEFYGFPENSFTPDLFVNLSELKQIEFLRCAMSCPPSSLFESVPNLDRVIFWKTQTQKIPVDLFAKNPKLTRVEFFIGEYKEVPKNLFIHNPNIESCHFAHDGLSIENPVELNKDTYLLADHGGYILTTYHNGIEAGCRVFDSPQKAYNFWYYNPNDRSPERLIRANKFKAALLAHYGDAINENGM